MKTLLKRLCAACAAVLSVGGASADGAPWEYDAAAQTISDGVWTLVVKPETDGDHELFIGPGANDRQDGRTDKPWAFPANYTAPVEGGAELDLSKPVYTKGDTSEAWSIVRFTHQCFQGFGEGINVFIAPKTLKELGGQTFNGVNSMTNVVFDCPVLEGDLSSSGYDFGISRIPRLVLNAPKLTKIGRWSAAQSIFVNSSFLDTDLATWDLTGIQYLGPGALQAGYQMWHWDDSVPEGGIGPTGILDLPNVETISECAFKNWMRVSSVALGTNGTLKTIGPKIFFNDTWNAAKIKVAAVGPAKLDFGMSYNFTVDTNAFLSTATTPVPFKEVWFSSKAPSVEALDNILVLQEVGENGAKPVKLFVPMYEDEWQAVCSPLTDEEKTLAAAETVVGGEIVGVYETQDGRRVAWLVNRSDLVEPMWEYDASAGTITDGYWTLAVSPASNAGELKVVATGSLLTSDLSGQIDLSRPVYMKGTAHEAVNLWKIVELADKAFEGCAAKVTSFYAPKTLKKWGVSVFNEVSTLTEVVIKCPELEGQLGAGGSEFGTSNVQRFVLNAPKLETIGDSRSSFASSTFDETNVSEWDLTSVKTIYNNGLQAGARYNKALDGGPTGDLVLPNVETIGNGAFDCWTRISSFAFGTNGTLKSLGRTLVWNPDAKNGIAPGPTKIDFGMSWDFTVHAQAFYAEFKGSNGSPVDMPNPIQEVWFSDKAPSVETLDRILVLQTVAEDGTKPVKIFAPMGLRSWKNVCSAFTEEEAVQAEALRKEGYNVIGVYETTGTDGQPKVRCAWLVQNPNFKLTTGFAIRIR